MKSKQGKDMNDYDLYYVFQQIEEEKKQKQTNKIWMSNENRNTNTVQKLNMQNGRLSVNKNILFFNF